MQQKMILYIWVDLAFFFYDICVNLEKPLEWLEKSTWLRKGEKGGFGVSWEFSLKTLFITLILQFLERLLALRHPLPRLIAPKTFYDTKRNKKREGRSPPL